MITFFYSGGWSVKERKEGEKRERWKSKELLVRREERKKFSMMKQTVLLSDWTKPPPMGGPAPWQQALSPREKQPHPSTPPYFPLPFSLSPSPSPIIRPSVFISMQTHGVLTYINKPTQTHNNTQHNELLIATHYLKQHSSLSQTQQTDTCNPTRRADVHTGRSNGAYKVIRMSHSQLFKCADWRWCPSNAV